MKWVLLVMMVLLSGCEEIFQNDLDMAREAQLARDWPTAERVLGRYLRVERDSEKRWEAWNLLLQAINGANQEPRASLECLDVMMVEYEEDDAKLAQILRQMGSYNKILRHYDKAAKAWGAYVELAGLTPGERIQGFRELASALYTQKHFEAAEDTLQQCMAMPLPDHDKIWCMLDLADAAMGRQHWEVVANLCEQIQDAEPDPEVFGLASYYWGDALEQMGKMPQALEQFKKARETYPNPAVIENRIVYIKKQLKAKN